MRVLVFIAFVLILTLSFFSTALWAYEIESENALFDGLIVTVGATAIYQYARNANGDMLTKVGDNLGDFSYTIDLELEKQLLTDGRLFIDLEGGGVQGIEDDIKVFSGVNADSRDIDKIRLDEIWYEHAFTQLSVLLTVGKIDVRRFIDTNEYANDETTQFLGDMFRNSPTIELPLYETGVRVRLDPLDSIDIELVATHADSHWDELYDTVFFAGQINGKPRFFGRPGNYRLLGWYDDRNHIEWGTGGGSGKTSHGFGVSCDQEISDVLGAFFRYGWQDPDVYLEGSSETLEHAASAGVQLSGAQWQRDRDVVGMAYGLIWPSDKYKDANSVAAKSEGHLELYYKIYVNEYISITPDLHIVWRPYGRDAANGSEAIRVFGVRGQVTF